MKANNERIIRNSYAEAVLAAKEKGLSGPIAVRAAMRAAAKVATRLTGETITESDVELVIRGDVAA